MAWCWNNGNFNSYSPLLSPTVPNQSVSRRDLSLIAKELEDSDPQCSHCQSYWHDERDCPQKPKEHTDSPWEQPCCYCKSPWHMGRNCSHNDNLRKVYDRLDVRRQELLCEAEIFGSSREIKEEIEEITSSMDMLLNGMVGKKFGGKEGVPLFQEPCVEHDTQANIADVITTEGQANSPIAMSIDDDNLTICTASGDLELSVLEHVESIKNEFNTDVHYEVITSNEAESCGSCQEEHIPSLTEVLDADVEDESHAGSTLLNQEGIKAEELVLPTDLHAEGISQERALAEISSWLHCDGLIETIEVETHFGNEDPAASLVTEVPAENVELDTVENYLLQAEEFSMVAKSDKIEELHLHIPSQTAESIFCHQMGSGLVSKSEYFQKLLLHDLETSKAVQLKHFKSTLKSLTLDCLNGAKDLRFEILRFKKNLGFIKLQKTNFLSGFYLNPMSPMDVVCFIHGFLKGIALQNHTQLKEFESGNITGHDTLRERETQKKSGSHYHMKLSLIELKEYMSVDSLIEHLAVASVPDQLLSYHEQLQTSRFATPLTGSYLSAFELISSISFNNSLLCPEPKVLYPDLMSPLICYTCSHGFQTAILSCDLGPDIRD